MGRTVITFIQELSVPSQLIQYQKNDCYLV